MNNLPAVSLERRQFLKVVSLSGVGFALGSVSAEVLATSPTKQLTQAHLSVFGPFIKVAKDNTITVVIKHLDKGQGVTTGLSAIVADEMDADWSQIRWEFAPADNERYKNLFFGVQGTGGSTAIANSWMQLRTAGAAAKQMLLQAAAQKMSVPVDELQAKNGEVIHKASNKSVSYGKLAELAATMPVPAEPKLKTAKEFTIIGKKIPRIDSAEKVRGKAQYTIDVRRPGMLYAVVLHAPKFGAKVKSVDASAALKVAGVVRVEEIPDGVAVLAKTTWDAMQGRSALKVTWDESAAEQRGSQELWQAYRETGKKDGVILRNDGDVAKAFKDADKRIELEFELPYLAHATMEPMNCVVEYNKDLCEIWTGSQFPGADRMTAASILGLPEEKVLIHTQFAGGSFGRRITPTSDYVREAVAIAKAINGAAPVSLQWTREDDMRAGYYRPMSWHHMQAAVKGKKLVGWQHRVVGQSVLRGTPFEGMIQSEIDGTLTEGAANLAYKVPNFKFDAHEFKSGVTTLWWRSVGHSFNAYTTEVFFDEVARAAGQDPVEFRLGLLKDKPRHAAALKLAADKAGWGKKLPANKARGVAVHESFRSFVAQVAEVTVNKDGTYSVDKITCAVDCGVAVTPDVIRAQMEGGIGFGLGACMGEAITLKDGTVEQNNFSNYFPLRFHKMPKIEVHIVESTEAPTGVGEPGTPPAGPAVANALRKFLKKPLTRLPFGDKLDLA